MMNDAVDARDDRGPSADVGTRLAQIADELRAIAASGLHYATDEYDAARYRRTRDLAAELLSLADSRSTVEIREIFRGDLGYRTPQVGADAVIFDERGRLLLVQRAGSGEWCLPGGAAEVGEPPSASAEREAWEETGLRVRATRLIGCFDNRAWGLSPSSVHAYHLVFLCEVVGGELRPSSETTDFRWVTEAEALELALFRTHLYKIPDAFRAHRSPEAPTAFH